MAEEGTFQFKSKDPELQKWLMAVLAKQQLENQQHISRAQNQMRQFIEMKFSGIATAKGLNEALGHVPRHQVPGQDTLPRPAEPKQPRHHISDLPLPCQPSEANTPAEESMPAEQNTPAKESMREPDTKETASTEIRVVEPVPTSGHAAKSETRMRFKRLGSLGSISNSFEQRGSLMDKLMHEPLDMVAALMILASTTSFFMQLQWKGYEARVTLDLEMPGGWQNAESTFSTLEFFFAVVFLLELALRLCYFKKDFFVDKTNILDACVVVITSIDTFLLSRLGGMEGNFTFVRVVRYAKLVRALRFVRVMKLCHPLRVLIRTIASSFAAFCWSMVIMAAYMLVSSLFVCQTLQEFIRDDTQLRDDRIWVEGNYGSAAKALWTMFEITFSGGWPTWVTPLIEKVSLFYAFYFAAYVGGVVFAVIRIITALFLKETLTVAANDQEMMLRQKAAERANFAEKLLELHRKADITGDGMIDWQEFKVLAHNPEANALFSSIELEAYEMESIFKLLDDGDGKVSFQEFMSGILRMTGTARSQDVLALMHDNRKILHQLHLLRSSAGAFPSCTEQVLSPTEASEDEDDLNILSAF